MEILTVHGDELRPEQVSRVLNALERGEVVMHATETCYGFTVDIFQEKALEQLYELKQMQADKPVSIMIKSVKDGKRYAHFSEAAERLAEQFWPGPLTLILPRRETLPAFLNRDHETVGLRCPDHALTQSLLHMMGTPLATTSANLSGEPEVHQVKDLTVEPALILDSGEIPRCLPSTIVKVEEGSIEIVRRGDTADEVETFIREELY